MVGICSVPNATSPFLPTPATITTLDIDFSSADDSPVLHGPSPNGERFIGYPDLRSHAMEETEIEDRLQSIVETTPKEIGWAMDEFRKSREKLEDRCEDRMESDALDQAAIQIVQGRAVQKIRNDRPDRPERVNFTVLGHGGVREWNDGNGGKMEVLIGYGIIYPEKGEPGVAVFICDETDGISIPDLRKTFTEVYEPKSGTFKITRGDYNVIENGVPIYVCRTVEDDFSPDIEEVAGFPEETRIENVRGMIPEVKMDRIKQSLSQTNSDGYPIDFGADIRRMECIVKDWYKGDGFNTYTVLDDSMTEVDDFPEDMVSEHSQTPGLTVWCPDEFNGYGCESKLELYGTVTREDSGQITMSAISAYPITVYDQEEQT